RFEQHCEGDTPALRGQIHWRADDTRTPLGPVAVPNTLWHAPSGSVPATGNYVYLEGESGDYIVGDGAVTYTQADALLTVTASAGHLSVGVNGDTQWTGDFSTMNDVVTLEVGYYAGLERWPFNNPAKGGLDWSGDGR